MRKLNKLNVYGLVVHCSATKPSMKVNAQVIKRWHTEDRGWSDIGYHFVINRDGSLETGRSLQYQGAHVRGYNAQTIGVCLIGGLDENGKPDANYTLAQYETLKKLYGDLRLRFPIQEILGHRDLDKGKDCPCIDVRALFSSK
ncbi:N-acetylmuramoyl-L-alanine amidase [Pleionea sp. CnH1-48]|uniref:N-acetylmuramoyl-L-alanine amidase n=1 Tax=Pleionea sp. CnH1-48 TaxID=2954494 RepID=UPI002097F4DD|nr:N-acetylmuramoyl-L-alanine amidase [Pleionea sp. CnH1-48]MCO7227525.1 N-acetylmuramoyl-L-alanine amidase [Pleionea sp. CnH1-48]